MDETDLTTAQSYRLNKIEIIQKEIELEREMCNALVKIIIKDALRSDKKISSNQDGQTRKD